MNILLVTGEAGCNPPIRSEARNVKLNQLLIGWRQYCYPIRAWKMKKQSSSDWVGKIGDLGDRQPLPPAATVPDTKNNIQTLVQFVTFDDGNTDDRVKYWTAWEISHVQVTSYPNIVSAERFLTVFHSTWSNKAFPPKWYFRASARLGTSFFFAFQPPAEKKARTVSAMQALKSCWGQLCLGQGAGLF